MRKQIYVLSILIILIAYGCKDKETPKQIRKTTSSQLPGKKLDSLVIEGNDIWVRDTPKTGKVLMKLDEGDACVVLDTGKTDTINGCIDHWYQINYKNTIGWVFGSQTNIKSQSSRATQLFLEQNGEKLMCGNINLKFIAAEDKRYLSGIIISADAMVIDTIKGLDEQKILMYDNGTVNVKTEDYNFDHLCDLIIIDDGSASHGTMGHYYFLYDLATKKFKENKSLPHRAAAVEIDKAHKKIIVYCSYKDCKGSYRFIDNKFKLVDGEYTNEL